MKLDRYNLGLIGYPLAHSLSPRLHCAALDALGLNGEYRLYPISPLPQGGDQLRGILAEMRSGKIDGLNVTIPHKQAVVPLMDELSDTARATGAVNTILRDRIHLLGDNTDVEGFLIDLEHYLPERMERKMALVLGAGGAARAIVYGLFRTGWQVVIAARRLKQAQQLAADLQDRAISQDNHIEPMRMADLQVEDFRRRIRARGDQFTLIVNATPLGMIPQIDTTPWPPGAVWPQCGLAYDLVYNPKETAWMQAARANGLLAVSGKGMLIEQAALAFELWTGENAPRQAMAMVELHPESSEILSIGREER